jgi:hypothetical protein
VDFSPRILTGISVTTFVTNDGHDCHRTDRENEFCVFLVRCTRSNLLRFYNLVKRSLEPLFTQSA